MSYRKIDTRIWNDEKFRDLSDDGKLFFLYLLTSPHSTPWGAYIIDDLYIQADLNFAPKQIEKCWQELANRSLTVRCKATRLVVFPNWFKYNLPENAKSAAACIRGLMNLPKSPVLFAYCNGSEWVRRELANRSLTVPELFGDEQEQEQEQIYCRAEPVLPDPKKNRNASGDKPIPYEEIIDYLNSVTGKNFRPETKVYRQHISARWNEGYQLDDFKHVVDVKVLNWGNDPKMSAYLRPETLFGTKMGSYLNESVVHDKDPYAGFERG